MRSNAAAEFFIKVRAIKPEALIWMAGLGILALSPASENHFSLCLFHYLDIWCPGCGLGRSISLIFRGDFIQSLHTHPLGFFALGVLTFRIFTLTKPYFMSRTMRLLPELQGQEMIFVQELIKDLTDDEAQTFSIIYRSRRKDPQMILLLTLLGFLGAAGIHRFVMDQIGMGILYFLTAGLLLNWDNSRSGEL